MYYKGIIKGRCDAVEKACEVFKQYLISTYVAPPMIKDPLIKHVTLGSINEPEMYRMQCINSIVYKFRMKLEKEL